MKIARSVTTAIAAHNVLKTGVHGVGVKYVGKVTNSDQLVRDADVAVGAAIAFAKLATLPLAMTLDGTKVFDGTAPTSWTDLDLSSVVGANVALVILNVYNAISVAAAAVRTKGDGKEYYTTGTSQGCAQGDLGSGVNCVFIVITDANGVIQWINESASANAKVFMMAYLK